MELALQEGSLEPFVVALGPAAEPIVLPVPAGAVKVLPRWAEEDGVSRWRLRYRAHALEQAPGRPEGDAGIAGAWIELELRPFTRELPLTGLRHGVSHTFSVALETSMGWSDWSPETACVPPAPQAPAKPARVFAQVKSATSALVRWTRPIDFAASIACGQILQYRLTISWPPCEEDPSGAVRDIYIDEDADCCEVGDLRHAIDYHFQVAARNVSGWGEPSDPSPGLRMPSPVPPKLPAPTLRRPTHHSAVIQWEPPPVSEFAVTSFKFRYTSDSFDSKDVHVVEDVSPTMSQYVIQNLLPGTTYYFQATAVNQHGMGIWSESSLALTTQDGREPSKVVNIKVPSLYKSFVTLQWPPAEENGFPLTKYYLRFSHFPDMEDSAELEPIIKRVDGFDSTDIRHLKKLRYFFQIASQNSKGMSEWSDPVEVDLQPPPRLEGA